MPYIKQADRDKFNVLIIEVARNISTAGELNYVISTIFNNILERYKIQYGKYSYKDINEIIGSIECAKMEFYRRIASLMEDNKIQENGDVYTCESYGRTS